MSPTNSEELKKDPKPPGKSPHGMAELDKASQQLEDAHAIVTSATSKRDEASRNIEALNAKISAARTAKNLSQNHRGLSRFFRVREEKWDCPLLPDVAYAMTGLLIWTADRPVLKPPPL